MIQRIRAKLSFANVVSMIALFVAFGGAAYAADGLITGKDIKPNAIKGKQVSEKTLKNVNDDCPASAPTAIADVCFSGPKIAATWQEALYQCGAGFLRLPDLSEAALIIGNIETTTWTTEVAGGTPSKAYTVAWKATGSGSGPKLATKDQTEASTFRCVTTPTDGPKGARP